MPLRFATLFRGFLLVVMIAHVMYMYGMARVMAGTVGFRWQPTLIGAGFALGMLLPLFFAAGIAELPDVLEHHRAERRFKCGQCPACRYDLAGLAAGRCPECGIELRSRGAYQFSWRTLSRFTMFSVAAWVFGCIICEAALLADEAIFRNNAAQRVDQGHVAVWSQPRLWPFDCKSLVFDPGSGVHATE